MGGGGMDALVKPQAPVEEDNGEHTNEEHEHAMGHLVDAHGHCNMLMHSLQGRGVENQLVFEKSFTSEMVAQQ